MKGYDRKQSEDFQDSQEEGAQLFPRHGEVNLKAAIEVLSEHYVPEKHGEQLVNRCFRCHLSHVHSAYEEFRKRVHAGLSEPKISNLYTNDQFVDLTKLVYNREKYQLIIPEPLIPPIPKELGKVLDQLFDNYGYVPNLERFLLFYPTYLQKHRIVETDLFQSGMIQAKSGFFVAFCGAAEMGSVYMMSRYLRLYLKSGGQTDWFTYEKYPQKLRMLSMLNRLMARAPWQITAELMQDILESEHIHWNRNELARYVQIMAFSHQCSTIALSMGLLPEEDGLLGQFKMMDILAMKEKYDEVFYESQMKQKLAVMIPVLKEYEDGDGDVDRTRQFKMEIIESKLSILKMVTKKAETVDNYMKEINTELTQQEMYNEINKCVAPLLAPHQVIAKRTNHVFSIDYSEYNYRFMAYPILSSLTHQTADKIEGLIAYSEVMTRGNFGSVNINQQNGTKSFRKAIRYYAENLCGYTHLQYDFKNNVSVGLTMALKFYIRLVMMSPLHISKQVLRATNHQSGKIECFDLGHIAVLIANTKMSLQLLFAVQAFQL